MSDHQDVTDSLDDDEQYRSGIGTRLLRWAREAVQAVGWYYLLMLLLNDFLLLNLPALALFALAALLLFSSWILSLYLLHLDIKKWPTSSMEGADDEVRTESGPTAS
jgi:hypothetical protein